MRADTRIDGGDLIPLSAEAETLGTHKFRGPVALVCDLLEQRAGDVAQAEMAALFGCSERQARRVFRYIAGESFRSAQVRARLTAARILVRQSSIRISHLSEKFGYSRRAKFDKSYESAFGLTPAADRAASREGKTPDMATQGVDRQIDQVYRAAPTIERSEGI